MIRCVDPTINLSRDTSSPTMSSPALCLQTGRIYLLTFRTTEEIPRFQHQILKMLLTAMVISICLLFELASASPRPATPRKRGACKPKPKPQSFLAEPNGRSGTTFGAAGIYTNTTGGIGNGGIGNSGNGNGGNGNTGNLRGGSSNTGGGGNGINNKVGQISTNVTLGGAVNNPSPSPLAGAAIQRPAASLGQAVGSSLEVSFTR